MNENRLNVTPVAEARLRKAMRNLEDGEKLELIEKHFARKRRQSGSQNELSVKAEARTKCGLSRTMAHELKKGASLKTPEMRAQFEEIFRSVVIAEPGSASYRREWAMIQSIIQGSDEAAKRHLLGSAVGPWSDTALDESKTDAEKILVGRIAQYILHPRHHPKPSGTELDIDREFAVSRGAKVNAEVVRLLATNETPPAGMFDHGTPGARRSGYNVFRIRLLSDQLGWQQPSTDKARCELLGRAYHDGMASALMKVDEELGSIDVSYSYRAFVLAAHAGEWDRAGEYALAVLKYFPEILTEKVATIKPLLQDRDVWPGVAALIALRSGDLSAEIRNIFDQPPAQHLDAIATIRAMTVGIKPAQPYLTVLKMEKQK